jgi:hypothetical protein
VLAAYFVDDKWCLVCETSVITLDRSDKVVFKVEHDEVFVRCWWEREQLVILDFQGNKISLSRSSLAHSTR